MQFLIQERNPNDKIIQVIHLCEIFNMTYTAQSQRIDK